MATAAELKLEIAKLTGAINRKKNEDGPYRPQASSSSYPAKPRSHVYINPNYKPPSKTASTVTPPIAAPRPSPETSASKDVVLGGVAFQSSSRSLVRKDLQKPLPTVYPRPFVARPTTAHPAQFARFKAGPGNTHRVYKPTAARRGRGTGRNMTLDNNRRPYQSRRMSNKRAKKYINKPCPRFSTTGACNRGLTCMYQHDPAKIAICWKFLQGDCPNTVTTCNLSHDPTPERTPLCVHFANQGRCTRANCPFPHVRVGPREGICRDFAVLGYCDKGIDCDKQHVRECPDFAEKGACSTKGCKLPHVIRANRSRKVANPTGNTNLSAPPVADSSDAAVSSKAGASGETAIQIPADGGQIGDEFISLTFHESDGEDSEDEESEGEEDEEEGEEEDEANGDADYELRVET